MPNGCCVCPQDIYHRALRNALDPRFSTTYGVVGRWNRFSPWEDSRAKVRLPSRPYLERLHTHVNAPMPPTTKQANQSLPLVSFFPTSKFNYTRTQLPSLNKYPLKSASVSPCLVVVPFLLELYDAIGIWLRHHFLNSCGTGAISNAFVSCMRSNIWGTLSFDVPLMVMVWVVL